MSALTETDPKAAGFDPAGLARIEPWMDRLVAEGRLAGLSVMSRIRRYRAIGRDGFKVTTILPPRWPFARTAGSNSS